MTPHPSLLPAPRQITMLESFYTFPSTSLIALSSASLLFEGQLLQSSIKTWTDNNWEIVAGNCYTIAGASLRIDPSLARPQGFHLVVSETGIEVSASDASGIFYGICTLRQIIQQFNDKVPCLIIEDWPDFPARGVMLDISRDKVPKLETVMELIDTLASLKINQLQLYMEHTFAYRNHPDVWSKASPFTGEDILKLDHFCRQRHVELVPNQNSLGHVERWLKHERYHHLAECPDGFEAPWGEFSPPTTLNPLDPASIQLMASLYDELLPHFSSKLVNVGGDEPWELGKGKSKAEVDARGGRVYLDYITKLHNEITSRGHKMQFWGDIIVHYPNLVPELPKDVTAMLWGYEGGQKAADEWERQCLMLENSQIPFYVCPGTSSWNSIAGRSENAIDNCRISAINGLKHGAIGFLNTDWGDRGHWQPLSVSYLGFAYGAAVSWGLEANSQIDLPHLLDLFVFNDKAGVIGKVAYDLGEIYKIIGPEHINGQMLFYTMQLAADKLQSGMSLYETWGGSKADISPATLHQVISAIQDAIAPLQYANIQRPDAAVIVAEFRQAADLMLHSAHRLLFLTDEEGTPTALKDELQQVLTKQQELWLVRNRPGGLSDSMERFDIIMTEYDKLTAK